MSDYSLEKSSRPKYIGLLTVCLLAYSFAFSGESGASISLIMSDWSHVQFEWMSERFKFSFEIGGPNAQ